MTESELKLSKTSRTCGPKKTSYDDLTKSEKCLVNNCYPDRYPSRSCSYCRFRKICDNK